MDYNLLYLYTSVVSMAFNIYSNMSIQRKLYNEEKKNLKYDDLSKQSKQMLKCIKKSNRFDNSKSLLMSFIPIYNICYTLKNIAPGNSVYEKSRRLFYNYIIEETNSTEEMNREVFLESLKSIKEDLVIINEEMKEKLDSSELTITEKEFKKVLKLNGILLEEEEIEEDINDEESR